MKKATNRYAGKRTRPCIVTALTLVATFLLLGLVGETASAQTRDTRFSSAKHWNLKAENLVPHGVNPYYPPLIPGYKFIMEKEGTDRGDYHKEIIVLEETEKFDIPGIGKFECAVVQEEEFYDGVYFQQALNWYCIDKVTNNVYSFGEISWEIDDEGDKVFDGTWRAGIPDGNGVAEPGLLMPGCPLIGSRYIFDGSESEAFGGSEIIQTGLKMTVPAGTFEDAILVREYSLTTPDDITDKYWQKGVGLLYDTSDGGIIASDGLPETADVMKASWRKFHKNPVGKPTVPPEVKAREPEAIAAALKQVPGKVTSVSIEKYKGKTCWTVEIVAEADGVETDVFVEIATGKVLGMDR